MGHALASPAEHRYREGVHDGLFKMSPIVTSRPQTARAPSPTDGRDEQGNGNMNNIETLPGDAKPRLKERLFTGGYLAMGAVAMVGWIIALGWATLHVVNWLIF
jgi:hypothetical protein